MTAEGETVRARLARIKGHKKQYDEGQSSGDASSLRERLERLERVRSRSGGSAVGRCMPVRCGDDAALADYLDGVRCAEGVIRIERRLALDTPHGERALHHVLDPLESLPEARELDARELVFVDTETTGLAGGTGTVVFMLGLARVDDGALQVAQLVLTRFSGEAALIDAARAWLEDAGAIATFNGKRFDLPLLAARCRLAGVTDPFTALPHLDLLYPVRRAYRRRWANCRLVTAERELLGLTRDNDLPGSMAPAAWLAYLQQGEAGGLAEVARHNRTDVVSLAALLPALAQAHHDPAGWGADARAIARAHRVRGDEGRALDVLEACVDTGDRAGLSELARMHRRRGEWERARIIWWDLAHRGDGEAIECLAKYYEHVERDPATALEYAQRLPEDARGARRRERLRRRLDAAI